LRPLFQFMRFFLGEPKRHCKILRAFECIPGSQRYSADSRGRSRPCSWRWRAIIKQASTQASVRPRGTSEAIALMNRLAGDPTVLRHSVIESFKTLPSIKMFGWPYDSGKLLNLRAGVGFIPRRGGLAKPKGSKGIPRYLDPRDLQLRRTEFSKPRCSIELEAWIGIQILRNAFCKNLTSTGHPQL
ncbi:hypothetical protein E4U30_004657, partial [Claviceps sp. LM220 group G6]